MRGAIIGLVAGVCLLQRQEVLPGRLWLLALAAVGLALLFFAQRISGGRRATPVERDFLPDRTGHACQATQAIQGSQGRQENHAGQASQARRVSHACQSNQASIRGWPIALRTGAGAVLGFAWAGLVAQQYLVHELDAALEGQDIVIVGVIDSLPVQADQGVRFNLQVESALQDGKPVAVPPRVSLGWYAERFGAGRARIVPVAPGERWQLPVRLQRPHGNANPHGFDYEVWLLEQNLRATGQVRTSRAGAGAIRRIDAFVPRIGTVVEHARALLRDKIRAALPQQPYAGALVALVIGDQRAIAQSDWKIFNRTGIGHLVSISGLHITMIAGLFAAVMHFLWRHSFFTRAQLPLWLPAQKAAALTAASTALLYVLLAGFGVPAQRTLYMIWVVAAALWCGRIGSVSHVLCLAAAVVILPDPWAVLWPGFWLSFGAVAIILYASVGRTGTHASPTTLRARWLAQLTSAAQTQYVVTLGLVPLTILLFGQMSLISPLANALAIPVISLLVTPLALAGSMLPAPLSVWLLTIAHALFAWLAAALTWLSALTGAVWTTPIPAFWMFVCALAGALWLLAPRGWPARWLGLAGWVPLLCNASTFAPAGGMTVTAFDVGQGMALLIETQRHRLLYDTGPYHSPESNGASRVILPYLKARGINRLDGVIISHSDNDHSGGALSLFEEIRVDWVASSLAADLPAARMAPDHRPCIAGQRWSWDGIAFEMLHPSLASYGNGKLKPNAVSCTLKITQGPHSILLPGDIESAQERDLVASDGEKLQSTILLAPHHGSGTSSTLPFLLAVRPSLAIFQVGYRNRYHHPKPQVFERYRELGIKRLRNDDSGAITLQFGSHLSVAEYRKTHARYWYGR